MRRMVVSATIAVAALLLLAAAAQAAAPTPGAVSATDIQGVSALLVGTVNPGGESTSYRFEYGTQGPCAAHPCTATTTALAGSDASSHPARAAISGLSPDTAYDFRLVVTNNSGTASAAGTFTTTSGFGFLPATAGFSAAAIKDGGSAASVAGTHPYQLNLGLGFNAGGEFEGQSGVRFPDGDLRDLTIDLPSGLLLNPKALDKCKLADFHTPRSSPFESSLSGESCPDRTQVGTIEVESSRAGGAPRRFGLFNLDPPPGVPAQLGASPFGSPIAFDVEIHTNADDSYTLSLQATDFPQALDVSGFDLALWGIPWNPSHNAQRGNCLNEREPEFPWAKCSVGDPLVDSGNTPLAYVTLPTSCEGPLAFAATADAWQQPARVSASALNRDSGGNPVSQGGCPSLSFGAGAEGFLTDTKASSASGFNFRLQGTSSALTTPTAQLPAQTRRAVVALPPGVTINPSLGAGLIGCTPTEYAAETAFSPQGAGCPNGSKIGDFSVRSPLFDELIEGAVYLAQPRENPFGSLLAVYLVAKSPQRGILVKLPGKLIPDPGTGNLTASFEGLPQIPYTDLSVNFRSGQRAPLVTPFSCGAAITQIDLTPWSGPGAKHSSTASQITSGVGGAACPSGPAPYNPSVVAGGVNSNVNSYTPYFIHVARQDNEAELTRYSLVLPKGITGKLAGIPFCPDGAIEAAKSKSGFDEAAHPACPAASQVGHTDSGYGVGSTLTYAAGRVYLAGPYHGAPLSLVVINPATVGPFDLGTIVVRSAFVVDPHSAQLRIDSKTSDPIPHILDGVPIHLRDLRIYMDRPQFTHNPSSCAPAELTSTLGGSGANFATTADDTSVTSSVHFQLLNCLTLGFKPKLGVRLRGGSRRGAYPQLRATFAARGPQDSNLKEITVDLPHSEFLAQNHIKGICTTIQFNADRCPADSVYGSAVARTPLFDEPLTGDVYLRSSSHKLPDLVASLHSGAIHIVLEGEIGPTKQGGISAYFADLPDEPLDRFVMTLNGGRHGLLQNSSNICAVPPEATVKALGQNNIGAEFSSVLRGQCHQHKKSKHRKRHAAHRQRGRGR